MSYVHVLSYLKQDKFAMGNSIYLISASIYLKIVSNISLSIASDLKRKQKQATLVLFRVPSS